MEKIKFTLHKPRQTKVIFIEELPDNKNLFSVEYIGNFSEKEKKDTIMIYEEILKEVYKKMLEGFEIMAG